MMRPDNNAAASNFMLLLKKYVVENKNRILFGAAALIGVMALLGFLTGMLTTYSGKGIYIGFSMVLAVMGIAGASQMFGEMKARQGRISTLMAPATVTAKFMVRWCVWVVGSGIVLLVAFEVGDLMRVLSSYIFKHPSTPLQWDSFRTSVLYTIPMCGMIYLAVQSFFVLGAILWPKLSFIKTIVALWVMQTVTGVLATVGLMLAEDSLLYVNIPALNLDGDWIYWTGMGFMALVCAVNWGLAWLRLKEDDVI